MSKKVTNSLVSDIKRDHVLTDRTVYNQLNWEFGKIIKNLQWSVNNKQEKIEEIDQIVQDGHTFNEETGSQVEPDWVQLANNRAWHEAQQEVSEMLLEYMQQANSALFPDVNFKARSQAEAFESLKKKVG